jgi:hypothetical protein
MSTTPSRLIPGRQAWELLRCSNVECEHETVRRVGERLLMLPCGVCRSEMLQLPLKVDVNGGSEGGGFDLAAMRDTLAAARERAQHGVRHAAGVLTEGHFAGRVAAYGEVLEMLAAVDRDGRSSAVESTRWEAAGRPDEQPAGSEARL